jgi:hypothetical protein
MHIYKALLYLYPAGFRREFGEEMVCDFADGTADARVSGGWRRVIAFWTVVSADLMCSVVAQWIRSGWPAVVTISFTWSLSCCVLIAQQFVPAPELRLRNRGEDDVVLMVLSGAVVFVLIAVIIVVTASFWTFVVRRRKRA